MLLVNNIQENLEKYVEGLTKRGITDGAGLLNEVADLDSQRKKTQQQLDEIKAKSNQLAKQIGQLFKEGKREEAEAAKSETAQLKEQDKSLTEQLNSIQDQLINKLYNIPNIPHASVPAGKNEEDNEVIKVNLNSKII